MTDVPNGAIRRDLDRHENSIGSLWKDKANQADITLLRAEIKEFRVEVRQNNSERDEEINSLRRTIIVAAVGVATSALILAASIALTFGGG